jgi:hypothetical protein
MGTTPASGCPYNSAKSDLTIKKYSRAHNNPFGIQGKNTNQEISKMGTTPASPYNSAKSDFTIKKNTFELTIIHLVSKAKNTKK